MSGAIGVTETKWVEAAESKPDSTTWYVTARRERNWRFTEKENVTVTLGRLNYPGGVFPSDAEVWLEIPPPPWLVVVVTEPVVTNVAKPAERLCASCGRTFGAGKHYMMDGVNYHEFEND